LSSNSRLSRQKISTTVAPRTLEYLEGLIAGGEAQNLAEALDRAIERLVVHENRERLATATEVYFENMSDTEAAEERRLEAALSQSPEGADLDQ